MTRRLLLLLGALALSSSLHAAPSCANAIPAGFVVTPACTWIVAQHDPGVFKDNEGNYWTMPPCVDGVCSSKPVKVQLSALNIGR